MFAKLTACPRATFALQAREMIRGWLAAPEMVSLAAYAATPLGNASFAQLRARNARAYPLLVDEMRGIAEGAGVALRSIWLCNVLCAAMPLPSARRVRCGRSG